MSTMIKNCPKCNKIMTLRSGKFGKFYACTGYPHCKTTEKFVFEKSSAQVAVKISSFEDTAEQITIFNKIQNSSENLLIQAGAGCGKTSTIVKGLKYIPENSSVVFLAFNKKIVIEIESRVSQKNVEIKTLHSLMLGNLKSQNKNLKVDVKKYDNLILSCGLIEEDSRRKWIKPVKQMICLLQANLLDCNFQNIKNIFENYKIEGIEFSDYTAHVIASIYTAGIELNNQTIDFNDMLYACAIRPEICKKFNVIFGDEVQDFSKLNLRLIENSLAPDGRIILVGDEDQSIYAFRGADAESINQIKKFFDVTTLTLTESFRIPAVIMELVNNTFPEIKLSSKKTGGKIDYISESGLMIKLDLDKKGMIICAQNSPLIKPCFELIRAGKNAKIEGRDIAEDLINLIVKVKNTINIKTIESLISGLDAYYNNICKKYENAKNKDFLNVILDQIETIKVFGDVCESIDDILIKIDSLFADNSNADYIFSSIHKSKGLEHSNIIILKESLIGKNAKNECDNLQAKNLRYVAYTRSLQNLTFCEDKK